jgi:hypothetical protein
MQGATFYIAPYNITGSGSNTWKNFTSSPLIATNFYEILSTGTTTSNHPDFSGAGRPIRCGFYTANSAGASSGYTIEAGYDNWKCVINTPPAGFLKICIVAGPGVTTGNPFSFTAVWVTGSSKVRVLAGSCAFGPSLPVGTAVTLTEVTIPAGNSVSSIAVVPPAQILGTANTGTGTVSVTIGSGVTEVTYTDQAPTGYLEICKQQYPLPGPFDTLGNSTFTVSPGNSGPIVVPAGGCSPAIEVPAGWVFIRETPAPDAAMTSCTTIPASQQGLCQPIAGTSRVIVTPGGISTQTIAIITNQWVPPIYHGGGGIGAKNRPR